ncbi:MAG: glycosyl hydrolase 53 family protein [Chloroflexi bacterium]|nr:glycosyl hydrolase 53 family protein [Chloroflexota bacterium]
MLARRIHALDMALLLDLHTPTWARSQAWRSDVSGLETAVYAYTLDLITALKAQGTLPHMVQISKRSAPAFFGMKGA